MAASLAIPVVVDTYRDSHLDVLAQPTRTHLGPPWPSERVAFRPQYHLPNRFGRLSTIYRVSADRNAA